MDAKASPQARPLPQPPLSGAAAQGQLPAMGDIDWAPDCLQDLLATVPPQCRGVNAVEPGGCVAAPSAMNPTGTCAPVGDHDA